MKSLFALTILDIINLRFTNLSGNNPNFIGFKNEKGNSVYASLNETCVRVSVFKVSKRCFLVELTDENQLEKMNADIKDVLKLL
jgi:hypothetical protein